KTYVRDHQQQSTEAQNYCNREGHRPQQCVRSGTCFTCCCQTAHHTRLPSAPSPESIGEPAAEEGSAQTTGETTEDNSSSRVNKRKTLDIFELTDSELAADERENSSDSTCIVAHL
ncbi:hypothetical protein JB92DRAFT_2895002, partial [Gautieria morchelliformis]